MHIERLTKIAIYHFKRLRSNCSFFKIHHYEKTKEGYIFYALFKCKRRITIMAITLSDQGTIIKS